MHIENVLQSNANGALGEQLSLACNHANCEMSLLVDAGLLVRTEFLSQNNDSKSTSFASDPSSAADASSLAAILSKLHALELTSEILLQQQKVILNLLQNQALPVSKSNSNESFAPIPNLPLDAVIEYWFTKEPWTMLHSGDKSLQNKLHELNKTVAILKITYLGCVSPSPSAVDFIVKKRPDFQHASYGTWLTNVTLLSREAAMRFNCAMRELDGKSDTKQWSGVRTRYTKCQVNDSFRAMLNRANTGIQHGLLFDAISDSKQQSKVLEIINS